MSDKNLTREESVEITGKFIEKLYPKFVKFVVHEKEQGFWLPEKFKSNPAAWLEILQEVEFAMAEYLNNKK